MDNTILNLISAAIGAVVGGGFSLATTIITTRSERKRKAESDQRNYKICNSMDDRRRRIDIYIEILNHIGNMRMEIQYPEDEETRCHLVNNAIYDKKGREFARYCETNTGRIKLFLPNNIYFKIVELRDILVELAEDKTMISKRDLRENYQSKFDETKLSDLQELIIEIERMIDEDLVKDCIHKKRPVKISDNKPHKVYVMHTGGDDT